MTELGLKWLGHVETKRSNLSKEAETNRHNVADEKENKRSNLAREAETWRHNLAVETETNRSNLASEAEINRSNLARESETHRANVAKEAIDYAKISENIRHNKVDESIRNIANQLSARKIHLDAVNTKLQRALQRAGLQLDIDKHKWNVTYQGHQIAQGYIKNATDMVKAIAALVD